MLIHQILGMAPTEPSVPHVQVAGITEAGIEIELENVTNASLNTEYWRSISDGSLRNNGREFVFNGPKGGRDLFLACVELDTFLSRQQVDGNWRCSTHVHVNMRMATVRQLKNTIIGALIYEKLLFRLSGFHRYSNNFCAAFGFAQHQLAILAAAWDMEDSDFLNYVCTSWDKYSALNLRPLASYGSIEFRSSAAEWRKGRLVRLANRFLALRDFCCEWQGSHEELIGHLASVNPRDIMKKGIVPKDLPEDWMEDVSVGVKLAHDLLMYTSVSTEPPVRAAPSRVLTGRGPRTVVSNAELRYMREVLSSHDFLVLNNSQNDGSNGRIVDLSFVQFYFDQTEHEPDDVLSENSLRMYRDGGLPERPVRASQGTPLWASATQFTSAVVGEESPVIGESFSEV